MALAACTGGETVTAQPESSSWIAPNSPPYPVAELSAVPVLRVGALEGAAAVEFTELVHVGVLGDGGIVVVDRGPNQIRWFDETGAFEYQAGGRGEGPGEFMYPVSATLLRGDTLVLYDGRTQRLTVFDSRGSLASSRILEATAAFGVALGGIGDGGVMAVEHRATFAMAGAEYNRTRDTLVLMVPALSASRVDTVARLPGPESVTWVDYDGDQPVATRQMELPLGEVALAAPIPGGFAGVPPGGRELAFYSLEGEVYGQAVRSDLEPIPVSRAIKAQFVAREQARDEGVPPGVVERDLEARFRLLADEQTVPAFDRILVATDGRTVWLRQYVLPANADDPTLWTVYDMDGAIQSQAGIPAHFRPTHIADGRIGGIETDGLGVEYAAVYSYRVR